MFCRDELIRLAVNLLYSPRIKRGVFFAGQDWPRNKFILCALNPLKRIERTLEKRRDREKNMEQERSSEQRVRWWCLQVQMPERNSNGEVGCVRRNEKAIEQYKSSTESNRVTRCSTHSTKMKYSDRYSIRHPSD